MNPDARTKCPLPVIALAVLILSLSETRAQSPFAMRNPALPKTPADSTPPATAAEPSAAEPYMLRPGVYVIPGLPRPDYWSPLMRRFPDYNPRSDCYRTRESYYQPLYSGYAYVPEPGYPTVGGPPYGHGWGGPGYRQELYDAYEQGRYDADHEYLWFIAAQRAGGLLNQYRQLFEEGIALFYEGRYDWAVIKLLGAAEKNHANAGSRLHAGHALFALGRYDEAIKLIARAFELSPSLISKQYDLRDEYANPADFDRQRAALSAYVKAHPADAGALTLLGYITFYSEGPGAAYPHLKEAARRDPHSYFIPKLLNLAAMGRGMPAQATPSGDSPRREGTGEAPDSSGLPTRLKPAPRDQDKHRGQDAVDDRPLRQVRVGP